MEAAASEKYEVLSGALDVLKDHAPYHEVTSKIERILRRIDDCELKACPFCGSDRVMEYTKAGEEELYGVMCLDCRGSGGMSLTSGGARENWNRREVAGNEDRE